MRRRSVLGWAAILLLALFSLAGEAVPAKEEIDSIYEVEGISEWNRSYKRPRTRFCILDNSTATNDAFVRRVRELQAQIRTGTAGLHDLFAMDRDGVVSALNSTDKWSSCPPLPLWANADWSCSLVGSSGILNLGKPLNDVTSIFLNAFPLTYVRMNKTVTVLSSKQMEDERVWLRDGFHAPVVDHSRDAPRLRCRHHGCDCRTAPEDQPSLCRPQDLLRILNTNEDQYAHKKGKLVLLLGGSDKPTLHSMVPYAKQMLASGWFNRIFWEANTIDIAGVDTYLKTMSMHYMLGREDAFLEAVVNADVQKKEYLALGAWGARASCRTCMSADAVELDMMILKAEVLFAEEALAGKNVTSGPWLRRKHLAPSEYFAELSKYKFMIAPHGRGIQSPKFLEALMVMTIPVTRSYHCFQQLHQYGMPIVLVDEWDELTPTLLEKVR